MANPAWHVYSEGRRREQRALTDVYLLGMRGGTRATDSRILGYDVMNEPHRTGLWVGGLPAFIGHAFERIGHLTSLRRARSISTAKY